MEGAYSERSEDSWLNPFPYRKELPGNRVKNKNSKTEPVRKFLSTKLKRRF